MLFLKIFLAVFIAEMGDKTQLMLVALTNRYKVRDIVVGTFFAILVLNIIAVLAGGLVGAFIPLYMIKLIASLAFLYFALSCLRVDCDDSDARTNSIAFAPLAVFCTFFIAELGDKTQLIAITFGANEGLENALYIILSSSLGLFAADIIGMMVGYLLSSRLPEDYLKLLSYIIFSIFGLRNLPIALDMMFVDNEGLEIALFICLASIFSLLSVHLFLSNRKEKSS